MLQCWQRSKRKVVQNSFVLWVAFWKHETNPVRMHGVSMCRWVSNTGQESSKRRTRGTSCKSKDGELHLEKNKNRVRRTEVNRNVGTSAGVFVALSQRVAGVTLRKESMKA